LAEIQEEEHKEPEKRKKKGKKEKLNTQNNTFSKKILLIQILENKLKSKSRAAALELINQILLNL